MRASPRHETRGYGNADQEPGGAAGRRGIFLEVVLQ